MSASSLPCARRLTWEAPINETLPLASDCSNFYLCILGDVLSLHCCAWTFSGCRELGYSVTVPGLVGLLLLRSMGCGHAGSVVVAHGLSCPVAGRISPDQGSHLCPLHWQGIPNQRTPREVLAVLGGVSSRRCRMGGE